MYPRLHFVFSWVTYKIYIAQAASIFYLKCESVAWPIDAQPLN